jgi:hypothetical protein
MEEFFALNYVAYIYFHIIADGGGQPKPVGSLNINNFNCVRCWYLFEYYTSVYGHTLLQNEPNFFFQMPRKIYDLFFPGLCDNPF